MKFDISPAALRQVFSARPANAAGSSSAPQETAETAAQRARIRAIFDGADRAAARRGDARATVDLIRARLAVDSMKKTPPLARALHRLGIRKSPESRTARIDRMLPLFHKGVLGRGEGLEEEKRGWCLPAWFEGLHTIAGSRLWYAFGALGVEEAHAAGAKIAANEACGPVLQAPASAYFRIATEVLQVLLNKGGKPKLPPNVRANAGSLKDARREFRAVRAALAEANAGLWLAIAEAAAPDAAAPEFDRLRSRREHTERELERMRTPATTYNYRFFRFKREYFGKRWSAAVSIFAGAVSAPLKKIPCASLGVKLAAVPLQAIGSRFDFVRMQEYTLRGAAKKVDLRSLLKPESRNKPLDQVTEADIDTAAAGRFYDEQPQLIMAAVREIYMHKLAGLNDRRLALEEEAAGKEKKADELRAAQAKLEKLKAQVGHFERGEADRIDLDGTIGKALVHPWYFLRKGTNAVFLNKVGEFWAQHHQRIFNSFNPFLSLGQAAILADVLSAADIHHGAEDAQMEAAIDGIQKSGPVYGANAGITVILARDNKVHNDRRNLGVPGRIARPQGVTPGTIESELADALNKGLLSAKGKKKIGKAVRTMQSAPPGSKRHRKAEEALQRWERLKREAEEFAAKINRDWIITDVIGKDGKPLRIDLRTSAACLRKNMPLSERIWIPVRNIPRGMIYPATMLKDALRARHARRRAHRAAEESRELIAKASELERRAPPLLTLNLDTEDLTGAIASALQGGKAGRQEPPSSGAPQAHPQAVRYSPLPIEDLRPRPLPPADYIRCIAAMLEDLKGLEAAGPAMFDEAERKQAAEELGELRRHARDLHLLAGFNRLRSLLTPGDDTHREWARTDARLGRMMDAAARIQARLLHAKNAQEHANVF